MGSVGLLAIILTVHAPAVLAATLAAVVMAGAILVTRRRVPLANRAWSAVLWAAIVWCAGLVVLGGATHIPPVRVETVGVDDGAP